MKKNYNLKFLRSITMMLALTVAFAAMPATLLAQAPIDPTASTTWDFTTVDTDGSGTGWDWVQSTKTLTLTNLNHTTSAGTALSVPDGTTIVLAGNNVITSTANSSSYGISSPNSLLITGDGSLTVSGGTQGIYGGYSGGSITINSGKVNATGGNYGITATGSGGIYGPGGTVIISGDAMVNAEGSGGIYGYSGITISDDAVVNVTSKSSSGFYGIHSSFGGININGGTITSNGGENGIRSNYGIAITGGNINVTGVNCGVYGSGGITISDCILIATGVNYGIYGTGGITISDCILIATGGSRAINPNFTVPNGYGYQVATNTDNTMGKQNGVSDGSFVVGSTHKYAKIGYGALDIPPPTLSAGSVNRTSDTEATIDFTTDEAGTAYYLVQNSGDSSPANTAVKAGTSLGTVASGANTGKAVTLTAGAKDIYVVVEDAAGNISEPLKIEAAAMPGTATIQTLFIDGVKFYDASLGGDLQLTDVPEKVIGDVVMTFSEPVKTHDGVLWIEGGSFSIGMTLSIYATYSNSNKTITRNITYSFEPDRDYTIRISEIEDIYGNLVSEDIFCTFSTVKTVAHTYTISASTLTSFGSMSVGYTPPASQTVTITNTGTGAVTLTQPTATNYNIGALSTTSLAAGATATFTVQPKAGLSAGNYNEVITISGNSGAATATVNANFTVTSGTPTTPPTTPPTLPDPPYIAGPASMTLLPGYAATSSEAFTVTGSSPVKVAKLSGDDRITWNSATKCLDIAAGLPVGIYEVRLRATNASTAIYTFTFTLTVAEPVFFLDLPKTFVGGTVAVTTTNANPYLAAAGSTVTLTVTPDAGYALEELTVYMSDGSGAATSAIVPLTCTGNVCTFKMPAHHITIVATFRQTATDNEQLTIDNGQLKAFAKDGILHISGLTANTEWRVYNVMGTLIHVGAGSARPLPSRGIYIVTDGKTTVKVVN
jgi:hypothetical protein